MTRRMGSPGDKETPKRRKGRYLTEAEAALWREVAKETRPLRPVRRNSKPNFATETSFPPQVVPEAERNKMYRSDIVTKNAASAPRTPPPMPPPLSGLDRRTSQRLARGQIEADARLDLHGMRQDEAENALLQFLTRIRMQGARCVLVITGKGDAPYARHMLHGRDYYEVPEHAGVLRASLPRWLNEPRFRALVAGFQPAHPRHGGGGAFYVWLRKRP